VVAHDNKILMVAHGLMVAHVYSLHIYINIIIIFTLIYVSNLPPPPPRTGLFLTPSPQKNHHNNLCSSIFLERSLLLQAENILEIPCGGFSMYCQFFVRRLLCILGY